MGVRAIEYVIKRIMQQFTTTQLLLGFGIIIAIAFLFNWWKGNDGSYNRTYIIPSSVAPEEPLVGQRANCQRGKFISKGEKECRRVLEMYYKKPFPNERPSFMKNSITGAKLELDCYNPELKVACEYHGVQHYKFTPRFHETKQHFYNQQYRDKETRELCRKNGVFLIEVPYTVKLCDIEKYILNKLQVS